MSEPIPPFAPYRTPLEPASNFAAARVTPFDLTGPLPSGTVVLQASAGTGKTYALAALATRYIAEGVTTLPGLLLVTFTHIATGELRSRVYDRLLQCHSALSAALHDETVPDNAVDKLLATAAPAIVSERLQRVTEALASIDLATIATIHQFAGQMLTELGALAAHDAFDQFVEDLTDLKHQVAADLYLEVASQPQNHLAQLPYPEFQHLITQALENNTVALTASDGNTALQATVAQARSEYRRRKAALRVYGFNDIMERLRQTLSEPDTQRAADTLARRFPVVLVDEFQDTDPEQWDILRHAFLGRSTLVLIGDPKQAIYRFRGADVFAYLEAVRAADAEYTLPTNYRADAPLVAAVSELFATANLGTPEQPITVPPVDAYHAGSRLRTVGDGAPGAAGVGDDTPTVAEPPLLPAAEIRVIDASQALPVTAARKRIDNDLCRVTAQLLANSRLIRAGGITTQLRPDDIAVLVSRNRRAEEIRDALTSAGIPAAIVSGARSVLLSDAAAAWLTLLEAVADATPTRVSRLALGPLVALSAAAIAADADLLPSLRAGLAAATSSFPSSGANGLLEWLRTDYDLTPRIMSLP
ncbi:MAG: UvrD-helicase domain-containing protein, partial [Propionibacteriaceae bacterium]|nr:UvrD-helicase domain-containing protein [Propionibacteriaceae bacterium]